MEIDNYYLLKKEIFDKTINLISEKSTIFRFWLWCGYPCDNYFYSKRFQLTGIVLIVNILKWIL